MNVVSELRTKKPYERITIRKYASEEFDWERDAMVHVWYRKNEDGTITTSPADLDLEKANIREIVCSFCNFETTTDKFGSRDDWYYADNVKCPNCERFVYD